MIRRPPSSPLFPSTPLFRSLFRRNFAAAVDPLLVRRDRRVHAVLAVDDRHGAAERLPQQALELVVVRDPDRRPDRKSTRLNSSHLVISYAVFCLKKKNKL